ncbi:hypothetical protein [Gordonia paraffinivorans]|uniref:hypothetical protein n=1 Tax=Gordonia paraffinivorans TaxID=175628 RepID=UPI003FCE0BB6
MDLTTTLVIAGYVATIASGALSAWVAGSYSARNARRDRLHAVRVEACTEAIEYAQIVRARLDSAEDEFWMDSGPTAQLPAWQPISARLHLLVPAVGEHFDAVAQKYSAFAFWCNENLAPDEAAPTDDTKPTRDAVDTLVKALKTAVN